MRDLHFFENELIAMQSGSTGCLLHIKDSSVTIERRPEWEDVFLDGVDGDENTAFMMGDPVNGKFSLFHFSNNQWKICNSPIAEEGEAGFAASGTNVQFLNDSTFIFVSGGSKSRFFKTINYGNTWSSSTLPFSKGEGIGAFSICMKDELNGVVVGGNYKQSIDTINTCFYTNDGGLSWSMPKKGVNGFRDCVIYYKNVYYACGSNGLDFSTDEGKTWNQLSEGVFFAMTADRDKLYLTSKNGMIVVIPCVND